jgi:predicted ATP-dependent protease
MESTVKALNAQGPKVDQAQIQTLTTGDSPRLIKGKSGAWGLSPDAYTAAQTSAKDGHSGAASLVKTCKEHLQLAKDGKLNKSPSKGEPKKDSVSYADQAVALRAANDPEAPKLDATKYAQIKGNLEKKDGKTVLTKEAYAKVVSAANRGNEGAKELKALAQEIAGINKEAETPARKYDYVEIADVADKVAKGEEVDKEVVDKYFERDDAGNVFKMKKEVYLACVTASNLGKEDISAPASAAVSIAKENFGKNITPATPEAETPKAGEPDMA